MQTLAVNTAPFEEQRSVRPPARTILSVLHNLTQALDLNPLLCLALLFLATVPYTFIKARVTRLSCDEVYTLRIAQQPTIRQMLSVSRRIDLHPPLHYLTERAALALPLPQLIAARLPSLLCTLGTLTFLFFFAARPRNALPGLFTATLFFFSPVMDYAWSNRPYAIWLFFLACSAWLWKRAGDSRSALWPLALFLSIFAMVMDHMSALACILPFMLAELLRSRRTRTLEWRIWIALTLPAVAAVAYLHQLRDFAHNGFAPRYLNWLDTAQNMYAGLTFLPVTVAIAGVIAIYLLTHSNRSASRTPETRPSAVLPILNRGDLHLGLALFLLPVLLTAIAAARHLQFFARYGACAAVGLAIALNWAIERWSRNARLVATLSAVALVIAGAVQAWNAPFVYEDPWRATLATGVTPKSLDKLDPTVPLVIASPIGYTRMNAEEPDALLNHTWYLTDRPSAIRYSGSTIFEDEATTARLLNYKSRTEPLATFLATQHKFYMVADYLEPEEWLPRALMDRNAHLQYLGKFASKYQDDDLYLVTIN